MARIHDRSAAGRLLAPLVSRQPLEDPVVLGIGPGGVAVGAGIAAFLHCPLDMLDIQEVDAGDALHPSRAIGAVSGDGHILVRPESLEHVSSGPESVRRAVQEARAAVARHLPGGGHPGGRMETSWRTLILVDDGSSPRLVLAAALDLARAGRPGRVLLAIATAPQEVVDDLASLAGDVVVGLVAPWTEWFAWHGRLYEDDSVPSGERLSQLIGA